MEFEDFKKNVEQWAEERGIYEQSTGAHQQAKALEEVGEYLTAETYIDLKDAAGDIAVCLVNAAKIKSIETEGAYQPLRSDIENPYNDEFEPENGLLYERDMMANVAKLIIMESYDIAYSCLSDAVSSKGLGITMVECLELAWDEIKNRKGRMIDGKFVKNA